MFSIPKNVNVEELRRVAESDVPVLAFAFKRRAAEDWAPEHSHARGQFFALTRGLLVVEAGCERWMFPSQRCAWIPPRLHAQGTFGGRRCRLHGLPVRRDVPWPAQEAVPV